MKQVGKIVAFVMLALALAGVKPVLAEEIRVAVAANFMDTIKEIARLFEQQSHHQVILASGSTGKHYAQIKHGAPFELFLAADSERTLLLEQEQIAVPGSRYTYAVGRVVLWSPKPGYVDDGGEVLNRNDIQHIAIANPKLAPYGVAAQEVLESRSLWTRFQDKLVRGETLSQTYQFVISGNAELGFVAYSQIKQPGKPVIGSYWEIPQTLYRPIEQQVVLLKDTPPARLFWNFLKGEQSRQIIRSYGYGIVE